MTLRRVPAEIPSGPVWLDGELVTPAGARGFVVIPFNGSLAQRARSRDAFIAAVLHDAGFGTLLFNLLTLHEERYSNIRYNVKLLAHRLLAATHWLNERIEARFLPFAYFASGTAGAACVRAAVQFPGRISAIAIRSGRPDLAGADPLHRLDSPTLLLLGGRDLDALEPNQQALAALDCEKALVTIDGASDLFIEPGTLDEAARRVTDWFERSMSLPASS